MAIYADLERPLGKGTRKLELITATGPAADVSIAAGAGADISISISPEVGTVENAGVILISGLPSNLGVGNMVAIATAVTLHVINPTAAAITVTAGSVTVRVLIIGY